MNRFDERLERDLEHIADRATPSPTAWEAIQTRIAAQADQPEMEIIMLDNEPPSPPRTGLWILSTAAALLLVLGGFVLLTRSNDEPGGVFAGQDDVPEETIDETPAPVEPTVDAETAAEPDESLSEAELDTTDETQAAEAAAAVAIAEQFMAARAAYDGDAVRALVADDASITQAYEWIDSPDGYPLLADYERANGLRFADPMCDAGSPGRVRCTYSLDSDVTVGLGVGPYDASFLLQVEDGLIRQISHNRTSDSLEPGTYFADVYRGGIVPWLGTNHPDDLALMRDQVGVIPPLITAESVALWEQHIPEYIASIAVDSPADS